MRKDDRSTAAARPLLVELIGPAGAGKSTVFERLLRRSGSLEPMPILRRSPHTGLLLLSLLRVLVMLARHRALFRRWTWRQLVTMAYLQALPDALTRADRPGERTIVFDQGPIFFLTRPSVRERRLLPWWQRTFETWAGLLDAVIWLEAPDAVLLERINARGKDHRMKGGPDGAAFAFLAESRAVYAEAMERLDTVERRPTILRFDTSRRSADEIVDAVLATLERLASSAGCRARTP